MNEYLDIEGNAELWSQTNFTQGSDFPLDVESIETHINGLFDSAEYNVEDIVSREPPRKSRIRNGPHLLPKIREQVQIFDTATPKKHQVSSGRQPTKIPLSRFATPSKTIQPSSFNANDGLYGEYTQQVYTQEQVQPITPPLPALDFTLSRTPEDHDNSFPSTYGSFLGSLYDQPNEPDLSHGLPCFPLYNDHYNLSATRNPLNTMQPGKAVYSSMYPSSHPRATQALTQEPCQSLYQQTSCDTAQSFCPETVSTQKTTLSRYLSLPNPAVGTVPEIEEADAGRDLHWWFDVRNVRVWSTFKFESMLDVPELRTLLDSRVPCDDLPTPGRVCLEPFNHKEVYFAHHDHYAVKINAALKASSAQPGLQMRDNHGGSPLVPDFLSSPFTGQEQATSGDNHVVGILLCHDLWNSGMRNDNGIQQVKYLYGLSSLQHALRKHNTRYGFIITEIELVCVKYGGDDIIAQQCVPGYSFSLQSPHFIPIFKYFEVSPAIPLSHNYKFPNRNLKMTAGLALWCPHMLAREQPLPGHLH